MFYKENDYRCDLLWLEWTKTEVILRGFEHSIALVSYRDSDKLITERTHLSLDEVLAELPKIMGAEAGQHEKQLTAEAYGAAQSAVYAWAIFER